MTSFKWKVVISGIGLLTFLLISSVSVAQNTVIRCSFYRDLKLGDTGEDVLCLQKSFNSLGYLIAVSGPGSLGNETSYFGPLTQQAVSRWQAANGITPTAGYFGPISRNKYFANFSQLPSGTTVTGTTSGTTTTTTTTTGTTASSTEDKETRSLIESVIDDIAQAEALLIEAEDAGENITSVERDMRKVRDDIILSAEYYHEKRYVNAKSYAKKAQTGVKAVLKKLNDILDTTAQQDSPVNGVCGSAQDTDVSAQPTGTAACAAGTYNAGAADTNEKYIWDCVGLNGGTTATGCYASITTVTTNGTCGTANATTVSALPTGTAACSAGTYNAGAADTNEKYIWNCVGLNGGTTATGCEANKVNTSSQLDPNDYLSFVATSGSGSNLGSGSSSNFGSGSSSNFGSSSSSMFGTGTAGGTNCYLWKPEGENTGKLVILLPSALTGKTAKKVVITGSFGTEEGNYTGVGNGEREHYRFSKAGSAYGNNIMVGITTSYGTEIMEQKNGGERKEICGSLFSNDSKFEDKFCRLLPKSDFCRNRGKTDNSNVVNAILLTNPITAPVGVGNIIVDTIDSIGDGIADIFGW